MQHIFYLSTCDTCKRILKDIEAPADFILQDIKKRPDHSGTTGKMKDLSGSYEALFSRRARLYKERNLKDQQLKEEDYKKLILEHYTFLKRPVIINDQKIFIGNTAKTTQEAKNSIHG